MIDTAVVVSALLFPSGRLRFLREAWTRGRLRPLVSSQTTAELLRVLGYPKFQLSRGEIETVLAAYLPFVDTVEVADAAEALPKCRDPEDQMFLELAHAGEAEVLVTGDQALLELNGMTEFAILTPADLAARL